ncbi:hypothetical protein [Streptomyces fodineus]|uniref:hypothetical protein n=1 Tax=Streptomyces fodineus TaxID=1904616 RepID=UPI00131B6B55
MGSGRGARVRARLGGPVLEGLPGALLDSPPAQDATAACASGSARTAWSSRRAWTGSGCVPPPGPTCTCAADEVVQFYGRAADPSAVGPRRELLAHRRRALAPASRPVSPSKSR